MCSRFHNNFGNFILVLSLIFCLSSCSDDDKNEEDDVLNDQYSDVIEASSSDLKYFILSDDEVEVTGVNVSSANMSIPEKVRINGHVYTVVGLADLAFCEILGSKVRNIILPKTITKIGENAFSRCSLLVSVNIPDGVVEIGKSCFSSCSSLKNVSIPSGVRTIDTYGLFNGCSSLTSVTIPNGVMEIGMFAFNGCSSLTSVSIPNGVTEIGWSAFNGCSSLTSIVIPNSVTTIGYDAFYGCTSLKTARVPKGLDISNAAFSSTCEIEYY